MITSYSHDFNFRLRKRQEGFKLNSPATKEVAACCCFWGAGANKNGTAWSRHGNLQLYIRGEREREPCAVAIAHRLYANKCLLNSWNENECRSRQVVLFIMKEIPVGCVFHLLLICRSQRTQPNGRNRFLHPIFFLQRKWPI